MNIKSYFKEKKQEYKNLIENEDLKIKLCIFQVGNNPASNRYVRNKIKDCTEVGIVCELCRFADNTSEEELIARVKDAEDRDITGLIVQLPLPPHIDVGHVKEAVKPHLDVDGFTSSAFVNPCTPQGIITYLEDAGYDFIGKNAVIIGRSDLVGKPMARMLLDRDCTISILHSKSNEMDKANLLQRANLVICATGHRNTITDYDFYDGQDGLKYQAGLKVFDVGINFNEEGKMVGDCENLTTGDISPVPGGCGLLTRLAVIQNLITLEKMKKEIIVKIKNKNLL